MVLVVIDDKGCIIVVDYFVDIFERLYLVGWFDYDIFGLLLMINDGDFVNLLMYLKNEVFKIYIVWIKGIFECEVIC